MREVEKDGDELVDEVLEEDIFVEEMADFSGWRQTYLIKSDCVD